MNQKNVIEFRTEAREAGLMGDRPDQDERSFTFDLNQGWITLVSPTPERALALVDLARHHAESARYGEHNALLNLCAERRELVNNHVYWHRPHHVFADQDPDAWVNLKDWLEQQGCPFVEPS